MKYWLFVFFFLLPNFVFSDNSENEFKTINIATELSSPIYEGRLTGSPGCKLAADFISSKFMKIGLDVSYQQFDTQAPFTENGISFALLKGDGSVAKNYRYREDFRESLSNGYYSKSVTGKMTLVSSKDTPFNKGALILINVKSYDLKDDDYYFSHGAKAIIHELYDDSVEKKGLYASQNAGSTLQLKNGMIKIGVSSAMFNELVIAEKNKSTVVIENNTSFKKVESENIIGKYDGNKTNNGFFPKIVFTAHYDHAGKDPLNYFPGAFDNASGVGMLIELAYKFSQDGNFMQDILFIALDAEEIGLYGSAFAAKNIPSDFGDVSIINIDMVGYNEDINVALDYVSALKSKELAQKLTSDFIESGFDASALGNVYNADHAQFELRGYRAVTINQFKDTYYHTYQDTVQNTLSSETLDRITAIIYNFVKKNYQTAKQDTSYNGFVLISITVICLGLLSLYIFLVFKAKEAKKIHLLTSNNE